MDKCNQVMNKDYNEYYQEKVKEFPMMKSIKLGKKSKDKINNENNNNSNIENNENVNNNFNNEDIIKTTQVNVKKKYLKILRS